MLTECPDCEKHFAGEVCACGYRKPRGQSNVIEGPWQKPAWMDQPKPCTAEENYRAGQLVQAILDQQITTHQAHLVLHAIFEGRELDEGVTVCECGIELTHFAPAGGRGGV